MWFLIAASAFGSVTWIIRGILGRILLKTILLKTVPLNHHLWPARRVLCCLCLQRPHPRHDFFLLFSDSFCSVREVSGCQQLWRKMADCCLKPSCGGSPTQSNSMRRPVNETGITGYIFEWGFWILHSIPLRLHIYGRSITPQLLEK